MKKLFVVAIIIFYCFGLVSADPLAGSASIEINLPSKVLYLYKDGLLLKEYPVCVGKQSTPTPQGEYRVVYKTVNPYWINKDVVVPPGPQNPLGVRWIGITKSIGIHGNNKPDSIGTYASAGCIRMYNRDVEELYAMVPVNTPVTIKYDVVMTFHDKYSGEKALIIYPDSYKKGAEKAKLLTESFDGMGIPEELIVKAQEALKKTIGKPQAVSQGIGVFLNDGLVTCDAFEENENIYVDYKAAEDILGLTAETAGHYGIEVKELEGAIYVNLSRIVKSFGGAISYDAVSKNAYINMKLIKINGAFAGINLGNFDKTDFLAAEAVKQLGYKHSEDTVDLRLFDNPIMKVKRNNVLSVNADNLCKAMGGSKKVISRYGIVDIKLPTYLKLGEEYFKTEEADGRLVISAETAFNIYENSSWAVETFSEQEDMPAECIDLELFLRDYDYEANVFGTVIEIRLKQN